MPPQADVPQWEQREPLWRGHGPDLAKHSTPKRKDRHMPTIINPHGIEIDFDAAANLMDDDICDEMGHGDGFDSEQAFFDAYCARHLAKFGEEFEPAKGNPVW